MQAEVSGVFAPKIQAKEVQNFGDFAPKMQARKLWLDMFLDILARKEYGHLQIQPKKSGFKLERNFWQALTRIKLPYSDFKRVLACLIFLKFEKNYFFTASKKMIIPFNGFSFFLVLKLFGEKSQSNCLGLVTRKVMGLFIKNIFNSNHQFFCQILSF